MKNEGRNYFVYTHENPTSGAIFYIGVGTSPFLYKTHKQKYRRAYVVSNRNIHWSRIYKKYGRLVKIVGDYKTREEAISIEKDMILCIGTRNISRGPLANIKIGDAIPLCVAKKISDSSSKREVYKYDLSGNFIKKYLSISDAWRDSNAYSPTDIWKVLNKPNNKSIHGFVYCYEYKDEISIYNLLKKNGRNRDGSKTKQVYQYSESGMIVNSFSGARKASIETKTNYTSIRNCLSGLCKTANGFYWSYSKEFDGPLKYEISVGSNVFYDIKECANFLGVTISAIRVAHKRNSSKIKGFSLSVSIWNYKEQTKQQRNESTN